MNERLRCWGEVLGATPEATLAMRRTAFRALLSGRSIPIDEAAVTAGLSREKALEAINLVASVGMAQIEGGTIFGIDGLSTRRTPHRLVLGDVELWTWCAYDIMGVAAALGADAIGTTRCGGCGRRIEVVIREGRPAGSTAIGWLPDESCSNVMTEFCPNALLFCSRSHLDKWIVREGIGSGAALELESLAERGRSAWRELVPS